MNVYLDAQDVSRLASPPIGTETFYAELKQKLKRGRQNGSIAAFQSIVLLSEISHDDGADPSNAVARATILRDVFEPVFLVSPFELLDRDVRNLAACAEVALLPSAIQAPTESIFGIPLERAKLDLDVGELRMKLSGAISKSSLPRSERRKLLAGLSHPQVILNNPLYTFIGHRMRTNPGDFPFSDPGLVVGLLTGKNTRWDVLKHFKSILQNPELMLRALATESDAIGQLYRLFRQQSASMKTRLDELSEKIWTIARAYPGSEAGDVVREQTSFENVTLSLAQRLATTEGIVLPAKLTPTEFTSFAPSLYTFFECVRSLTRDKLLAAVAAGRAATAIPKFKATDITDAFHTMYAPFMDAFRADRGTAEHATRVLKPYSVKVCRTIGDLDARL